MTESGLKILVSPVRFRLWAQLELGENSRNREPAVPFAESAESTESRGGGTQQVHGASCRIQLAGGFFALVSPEDFERANAIRWHIKRKRSQPGKFYAQRTIRLGSGRAAKKTAETLHRFILGAAPGEIVDHRDGDGLNNQRGNLRLATSEQNNFNVVRSKNRKRGGFKGVTWNPAAEKWQASICAGERKPNGKRRQLYLGIFEDPADAARAYDAAAREHFGEFASLNFPIAEESAA